MLEKTKRILRISSNCSKTPKLTFFLGPANIRIMRGEVYSSAPRSQNCEEQTRVS